MRHAGAAFVVVLGVALALVPRPPRAEAAMVCELGGSGQSCAEFPIVTHWVADSGGGGFFDLAGSNADPRRLMPPSYQNYSAMITDTYAPSDQDVLNFINAIDYPNGGIPVVMYNYDSDTALSKLQPGLNEIQVLHNVLLPLPNMKMLFTFIFLPGWQPTGQYPILLSGNGGGTPNNQMFFTTEQTRAIASYVGLSTQQGRTGLIAALSNAGGREALGWHQTALDDVARMLTFMQLNGFGVDPFRLVNFGGSRGGGTALLWGENPDHGTEYASIGVFAMAPPSHGGFISQQGIATYQGLAGATVNTFNDETADRYNRTPRLIDVNPAPILTLVLDAPEGGNPWKADRPQEDFPGDAWRKSPSGYLSFLRNKPIVLSVGSHDAIIPLPMVLKLERTLRSDPSRTAPLTGCLTLRTGHNADEDDCPRRELEGFLTALVTPGQAPTVTNGRRYFKATDLTNHPSGTAAELPTQSTLPFSITVPYRLRNDQWATLAACGQTGKPYSATLRDPAGAPVFSVTRTFGENTGSDFDFNETPEPDPECDVIRLHKPGGWGTLTPGSYWWSFIFDGRTIDAGNLSYLSTGGSRPTVATTVIDSQQPSRPDALFDPMGFITMGVGEF